MNKMRHPMSAIIAGWWRDCRSKTSRRDSTQRTADELGLTPDQLRTIASKAFHTSNLLPLRMSLLHLDPAEVAHSDPKRYRDLEASCKLCEDKGRCTWDIAQDPAHPRWQEYCPNAGKLRAMKAGNPPNAKSQ